MDGLTNRQRAAAWLATWNPSFVGKAIVSKDFEFLAVNDQFCEILGVTPADLLEHRFTDMTPEPDKTLDRKNAELVIKGKSPGYLLPKTYQLPNGKRVEVLLMAVGIKDEDGMFDFFMSRIVEAPEIVVESAPASESPKEWSALGWIKDMWKILTVAVPVAAWVIYELAKLLAKGNGLGV